MRIRRAEVHRQARQQDHDRIGHRRPHLKNGKPILVDLQELGIAQPLEILIFHKPTLKELHEAVKPLISPETTINLTEDS